MMTTRYFQVLADVVLSNIIHLEASTSARVLMDVRAGAGAGAAGFVDAAVTAHTRGDGRGSKSGKGP
jgi:hypothetical protein